MQTHWKTILFALVVAVGAFILSVMVGDFALTYAAIVSAFVFFCAYLISVAKFKDRPDTDSKAPLAR